MTGDSTFLTDLICALCPGLGWRLHPFAFKLDFERIAIFPMPLKLPVPVPVPRWELLPGSLVALLFASPLVLPLAKVLSTPIEIPQAPEPSLFMDLFPIAKAATKGAQALEPGVFIEAVLSSPAVWVDVFVSVATVLIRKHKKAYESALEERKVESEKAVGVEGSNALFSVEVIEEKWKEDFDQRLGRKDD